MRRYRSRILVGWVAFGIFATIATADPQAAKSVPQLSLDVRPTIFFTGEAKTLKQRIDVVLDYAGPAAAGELRIKGLKAEIRQPLPQILPGKTVVPVFILDLAKPVKATFSVKAGKLSGSKAVTLSPQRKWTMYLLPHSHTDIGYTELQSRVAKNHVEYLDQVVEFCRETDGYPDEAKFRWNIEVGWALENYIKSRSADQIQALVALLKSGRVELSGWYLQLSDAFAHEELLRTVLPSKEFSRTYGFPLRSAMNNDVTGFSWAAPQILNQIGVKYFTTGINETRSRAPLRRPNPFYWQAPDGSQVLHWNGEHYLFANYELLLHEGMEKSAPKVSNYLAALQTRGDYPYDLTAFHISGYVTDNCPPKKELSDRVREWNAAWAFPKLRLATMSDFFGAFEKKYAKAIPTHKKAWPDYWTDGIGSTAYETGLNRQAHDDLITAENLAVIASLIDPGAVVPRAEIREGYSQTMLFDEHTWGAFNSIDEPESESARGQWAQKSAFAYKAREIAKTVLQRSLPVLTKNIPTGAGRSLAVFNPLSWSRTDVVRVGLPQDLAELNGRFRLIEKKTGGEMSYQIVDKTTLLFQANDVPSIGYSVYTVVPGALPSPPAPVTIVEGNMIENRFYKATADPITGGLRSVVDKESGRELVDPGSRFMLNHFVYDNPEGGRKAVDDMAKRASFKRYSPVAASAGPGLQGPIASSLVLTSKTQRHPDIRQEVVLYDGIKRVDLVNRLTKEETFEPEAGYFAFPFKVEGGKFRFEIADATMAPESDQLPGTTRDWHTVQNWVEAAGPKESVVWSPIEAPLIQFGDINTGKWLTTLALTNQTFFSYAFNNLWMTNFKASQGGTLVFRYAFTSRAGGADAVASSRFGAEARTPIVAAWLPEKNKGTLPEDGTSFFEVDKPNVLIQALTTPETGEGIAVRLREIGGIESRVRLSSSLFAAETLTYLVTDLGESPANAFEVVPRSIYATLKPYQIVTVKVKIRENSRIGEDTGRNFRVNESKSVSSSSRFRSNTSAKSGDFPDKRR
jgi:alpha-mannosidase